MADTVESVLTSEQLYVYYVGLEKTSRGAYAQVQTDIKTAENIIRDAARFDVIDVDVVGTAVDEIRTGKATLAALQTQIDNAVTKQAQYRPTGQS